MMIRNIPNSLTLLNLVSGFIAILLASKGHLEQSCIFIMAGMILDFSDGFAARLLKAYSDIGRDLDSLADVVTFGVAPGTIVWFLLTGNGLAEMPAIAISSLLPAASALRLAKFNNDTEQSTYFKGMATPASAFTLVAFVIASRYTDSQIYDVLLGSAWFVGGLSLFLAMMMLVNARMFSLKFSHIRYKGNEERYIFAGVTLLLVLLLGLAALPLIMLSYILISLLFVAFRHTKKTA